MVFRIYLDQRTQMLFMIQIGNIEKETSIQSIIISKIRALIRIFYPRRKKLSQSKQLQSQQIIMLLKRLKIHSQFQTHFIQTKKNDKENKSRKSKGQDLNNKLEKQKRKCQLKRIKILKQLLFLGAQIKKREQTSNG